MTKFEKLRIAMRYRLIGSASVDPSFKVALAAFDFSEEKTIGTRKDKVTPNFMHPIEVTAYLMTLQSSLRFPAETFAAALLHDVVEDSDTTVGEIEDRFGKRVAHATRRLSKVVEGRKALSLAVYFEDMLDCPLATAAKGSDRINNQSSMVGVFSTAKQIEYIEESETYILPMLKKARRIYSDQEAVYENIKLVLCNQIALVRAMTKAS